MWLSAFLPVYLIAILVVGRFCSLAAPRSGAQERPEQPARPPSVP